MVKKAILVLCLALVGNLTIRGENVPVDTVIPGGQLEIEGELRAPAEGNFSVKGALSLDGKSLLFKGKASAGGDIGIQFMRDGKTIRIISIKASDRKINLIHGYTTSGQWIYPDNDLVFSWHVGDKGASRYSVRPNPEIYEPEEQAKRRADWLNLPGASDHLFTIELRPISHDTLEFWIDGQFVNLLTLPDPLSDYSDYEIKLSKGAVAQLLQFPPRGAGPVRLPIALHPRVQGETSVRLEGQFPPETTVARSLVEGMVNARLKFDSASSLTPGLKGVDELAGGIAIGGLGKIVGVSSVDLQSRFWARQMTDNLPEQRLFSVPLAPYSYADILCAVDENQNHTNTFTFRVTRYGRSRGDAMADTLVTVPRSDIQEADGVRKVGTVSYGPDGARKTALLWLIKVPIKNGAIADLLSGDEKKGREMGTYKYLDVELLDPLENVEVAQQFPPAMEQTKRKWAPTSEAPKGYDHYERASEITATSGVTVFAVDLVHSPVSLSLKASTGVKVFYASDHPTFDLSLEGADIGAYAVDWAFADIDGNVVEKGEERVKVSGAETKVSIPVRVGNGWYAARFAVKDTKDQTVNDVQTSFVMLPPDTRKAGYESPFYAARFGPAHNSNATLDEIGPLLQRMGVRRAELSEAMPESESQKYHLTASHIAWTLPGSGRQAMDQFRDGVKTLDEAVAMQEAHIRQQLELWPHIDRMLVFHESGARGAPFPSELWGDPARPFAAQATDANAPEALLASDAPGAVAADKERVAYEKNWPKRITYLTAMSQMVREKFPQLKMQYGNDGNSLALMGELFRREFPKKWIDTIAVEDLGQTFLPENVMVGGLHSAWFLRELARKTGYGDVPITSCTEWINRMVLRLGLRGQAEWKARDALIALAYGFDTISLGTLNDSGVGYYFSGWGNGGLCNRYPLLAPKPSYAALATLTQVLDQAKFVRFVPTGSTVAYVEEFQKGNEWVYAIWTPRGTRDLQLEFPSEGPFRLVDLYGRETTSTGKALSLKSGTAPQYVVSDTKLTSAVAGESAFPEDAAPANPEAVIALDDIESIEIAPDPKMENTSKSRLGSLPHYKQGEFVLREVEDPAMGKCIEIELLPQTKLRWEMEHEYVFLKLKVSVPTNAKNAGVWVKGNGSWGEVNIVKKQPWGSWATTANQHFSWRALAAMNFDGWNFIRYPYYDWLRENKNEVVGLRITMPRNAVVGTEMQPVGNLKIRIKSIVLF